MRILSVVLLLLLMSACAAPVVQKTPLEIQSMQTRDFEVDRNTAFRAVLSVFQDVGYIVESADNETGFITGSSPTDSKTNFWTASRDSKTTRATAFVEELRPNVSRVRLTFVNAYSSSSSYGQYSEKDTVILEPGAYASAFERIENAIFVRTATQ
ncbi:MAG: hypothetical protein QNK19_17060 [Xanthomonadales bacterium]|nr:hypothetical protein [Xanthomonadales bacterium]